MSVGGEGFASGADAAVLDPPVDAREVDEVLVGLPVHYDHVGQLAVFERPRLIAGDPQAQAMGVIDRRGDFVGREVAGELDNAGALPDVSCTAPRQV